MSKMADQQPFSRRALIALLFAGIVGFIAFLLLTAFTPDLRNGRNGGAHAMSTAAVGFRGLYLLNEKAGGASYLIRDREDIESQDLLVLTPQQPGDAKAVADLARERIDDDGGPTLIILPKWIAARDPRRRDWVINAGSLPTEMIEATLKDIAGDIHIERHGHRAGTTAEWSGSPIKLPTTGQSLTGKGFETLIEDPAGGALLAKLDDGEIYVLADPDVANNMALKDKARARAILDLLWVLNPAAPGTISFDVTVPGLGRSPNLLKLAFEPPFLAVTLCLFAAALLAGIHAVARFGPALAEARPIPFGKAALIENSADLIRSAGHEHRGGARYVALTRDAVAHALGIPADTPVEKIDSRLDRLTAGDGRTWSELAHRALQARNRNDLMRAARALHDWRKDVTGANR